MANKTSTIHLRIEPDLKAEAELLFKSLGLSTTDAIKIFLHQVVLTGGLPFPVKMPQPNEKTLLAMKEAELIAAGRKTTNTSTVEELFQEQEND